MSKCVDIGETRVHIVEKVQIWNGERQEGTPAGIDWNWSSWTHDL